MATGISRDLVEEYFRACVSRDPERIARCLDDDVQWTLGGPVDLLPFCGQKHGKQAVIETIVRLTPQVMRMTEMDIEELLIEDNRAAAFLRVSAIHASTGRTVSYRNAHFLRYRDGKLVELRALIDTFDAAEQLLGHPINTSLNAPSEIASRGNRIAI